MLVVTGCTGWQNPLIKQAWQEIDDKPEAARTILAKVHYNSLSESDKAEYGLLSAIVDYETSRKPENDSLISASITYYNQHGDNWHRGRAYFYRGAVRMFKFGNIPEAVGDFKVAETIAEKSNDEELKSRVYERLFYANFYIGSNTSVIKYARKLLNSSTHLNDSTMMLKSMLMCATAHADMDRMDSAYAYIKKGIKLKKDVDWFQLVDVDANGIRWYLTMAYIRKAQGQYDSAIELAKDGLTDIDQKTRMKSMQLLAELYEQTGDKKQAEETKMQLKEYEDSMKYVKLGMQMIDWQNTFDERQQTQEFYRQTAWMQGVITMIVILAALAIGIGLWLHRRKVRRLSHQLDEDAQSTNELRSKMGLLENRMERISNTLLIGTQMYNQLQQRQCIAEATAKEQQSLVDYFTQLRPKRWQEWQRKYNSLSTAQYVFLIMQDDLHYDDEAIANALNVKRTSVRSMRSRIKSRER